MAVINIIYALASITENNGGFVESHLAPFLTDLNHLMQMSIASKICTNSFFHKIEEFSVIP